MSDGSVPVKVELAASSAIIGSVSLVSGQTVGLLAGSNFIGTVSLASANVVLISTGSGNVVIISAGTGILATENRPPVSQCYSASVNWGLAAAATDIFTITGSTTKTVRVTQILFFGSAGSTQRAMVRLLLRSAANTGGVTQAPTIAPHDQNNAAVTAPVVAYTANPASLGTQVGTLGSFQVVFLAGAGAGTSSPDTTILFGLNPWAQPITLRGVAQVLAINMNGATVTGNTSGIANVTWIEE